MKRTVLFFLACIAALLLILTGCSQNSWNTADMMPGVQINSKSVEIAEDCRVTRQSNVCHAICGSLYNPFYTEIIIKIGTPSLEVLLDGAWYKVPSNTTTPAQAWNCPLEKRSAMNFVLNLNEFYDSLPSGTYRYVFTFQSDSQSYLVPVEFVI